MTIPQRALVTALTLACLGLGIYGYSEHVARLDAEEQLQTTLAQKARLAKARVVHPVDSPAPATANAASSAPSEAEPAPGGPNPERRGGRFFSPEFAALMDSPEMQQLMNLRARGSLDAHYAALFKQLHLSPEQLQRFQELLLDKQSTARDVIAAMRSQGITPGRDSADQMRTLIQNANNEIDTQIRAELGDAAFADYKTYEQTQPQRTTVEQVQQRLSYTAQPLTDEQAAQLVAILAQNAPAQNPDSTGSLRRLIGGNNAGARITPEAVSAAAAILSPAQVGTLQQIQQEQAAQAQLARQARENFAASRSAPSAARPATPAK